MVLVGFLAALAAILLGAHLFTAGVERIGAAQGLGRGVMGSLLAAVGTALPESILPLVAFLWGGQDGDAVGVGAILGAPLMLGSLAMALLGAVALVARRQGRRQRREPVHTGVHPEPATLRRDLGFYVLAAGLGLGVAAWGTPMARGAGALLLLACYALYAALTLAHGESGGVRIRSIQGTWQGIWRLVLGVGVMVLAAHQFVAFLEQMAHGTGISPFVFATLLAPVATELPEKFASILWLLRGHDDLAVGNVTGAMVFQSTVIPAMGMLLTPWHFGPAEYLVAGLAILSGGYLRLIHRTHRGFAPLPLLLAALPYATYLYLVMK